MNDEFIEDELEITSDSESTENIEESSDLSTLDFVSEDCIYEDISEVVSSDIYIENNSVDSFDNIAMEEDIEIELIDYTVSLDNISIKLDNVISSISDNKVDYVYDYNYNIVSVLLLSAVVGVLLFSLFTRRF